MRPSHAGRPHVTPEALAGAYSAKDRKKHSRDCQVKSRNEPANIRCVRRAVLFTGLY
jgi:TatD DNase family protein